MDYIEQENDITRKLFDIEEILNFPHDVQIIRGEDFMYCGYINKKSYSVCLTPLGAMVQAIKIFKEKET